MVIISHLNQSPPLVVKIGRWRSRLFCFWLVLRKTITFVSLEFDLWGIRFAFNVARQVPLLSPCPEEKVFLFSPQCHLNGWKRETKISGKSNLVRIVGDMNLQSTDAQTMTFWQRFGTKSEIVWLLPFNLKGWGNKDVLQTQFVFWRID